MKEQQQTEEENKIEELYKSTLPDPDTMGDGNYRVGPSGKREVLINYWEKY